MHNGRGEGERQGRRFQRRDRRHLSYDEGEEEGGGVLWGEAEGGESDMGLMMISEEAGAPAAHPSEGFSKAKKFLKQMSDEIEDVVALKHEEQHALELSSEWAVPTKSPRGGEGTGIPQRDVARGRGKPKLERLMSRDDLEVGMRRGQRERDGDRDKDRSRGVMVEESMGRNGPGVPKAKQKGPRLERLLSKDDMEVGRYKHGGVGYAKGEPGEAVGRKAHTNRLYAAETSHSSHSSPAHSSPVERRTAGEPRADRQKGTVQKKALMRQLSSDDSAVRYAGSRLRSSEEAASGGARGGRKFECVEDGRCQAPDLDQEEVTRAFFEGKKERRGMMFFRSLGEAFSPGHKVLGEEYSDLESKYQVVDKTLGTGMFGVTRLVKHRSTGKLFACKTVNKSQLQVS